MTNSGYSPTDDKPEPDQPPRTRALIMLTPGSIVHIPGIGVEYIVDKGIKTSGNKATITLTTVDGRDWAEDRTLPNIVAGLRYIRARYSKGQPRLRPPGDEKRGGYSGGTSADKVRPPKNI